MLSSQMNAFSLKMTHTTRRVLITKITMDLIMVATARSVH